MHNHVVLEFERVAHVLPIVPEPGASAQALLQAPVHQIPGEQERAKRVGCDVLAQTKGGMNELSQREIEGRKGKSLLEHTVDGGAQAVSI